MSSHANILVSANTEKACCCVQKQLLSTQLLSLRLLFFFSVHGLTTAWQWRPVSSVANCYSSRGARWTLCFFVLFCFVFLLTRSRCLMSWCQMNQSAWWSGWIQRSGPRRVFSVWVVIQVTWLHEMPKYPSASSEGHSKLLLNIDFSVYAPWFCNIRLWDFFWSKRGVAGEDREQRWECGLLFHFYTEMLI